MDLDNDYIRRYLKITKEILPDEDIEMYMEIYKPELMIELSLTEEDLNDERIKPLFKRALITAIGCELVTNHPDKFYPAGYKVGDTSEDFDTNIINRLPTWCDKYRDLLNKLYNIEKPTHNVSTVTRRGTFYQRRGYYRGL